MASMNNPYATSNYTGNEQPLSGTEFIYDDKEPTRPLPYLSQDFWRWAYSDLLKNTQRAVFAEYVVKIALELGGCKANQGVRSAFEPFDLLGPNIGGRPAKIEVKSAATVQAWTPKHSKISFSIAPARLPDEKGDYHDDAPIQRNSDIYVFCIYDPRDERGLIYPESSVLNMRFWRFYVCPSLKLTLLDTYTRDEPRALTEWRKTVTEKILNENLHLLRLRFSEVYGGIVNACDEIQSSAISNSSSSLSV